jgi:hypothetical protein
MRHRPFVEHAFLDQEFIANLNGWQWIDGLMNPVTYGALRDTGVLG